MVSLWVRLREVKGKYGKVKVKVRLSLRVLLFIDFHERSQIGFFNTKFTN